MCRQWAGQHLKRVAQLEVAGLVSALGKLDFALGRYFGTSCLSNRSAQQAGRVMKLTQRH